MASARNRVAGATEGVASGLSAALRKVDRPLRRAATLPGRLFSDPVVFAKEMRALFQTSWVCIGREDEIPDRRGYRTFEIAGLGVVVLRDDDRAVRAHDIDGRHPVQAASWRGFLFLTLNPKAPRIERYLGGLVERAAPYPLEELRLAHRHEYEIAANWKLVVQNANECYHCPGVHPQLVKLTPYRSGEEDLRRGPVFGGWMDFVAGAHTLSPDGTSPRLAFPGLSPEDLRRVYYYVLYPGNFLSLLPDYVTLDRFIPVSPERTRLVFDLYVARDEPDLAEDAMDFWDTTNRQDWHICELAHLGSKTVAYEQGRYSTEEEVVHLIDRYYLRRMGFVGPSRRRSG